MQLSHALRQWLVLLVLGLAACGADSGSRGRGPIPHPPRCRPNPLSSSLTYIVQRGPVARELAFTARVAPVQEAQPTRRGLREPPVCAARRSRGRG